MDGSDGVGHRVDQGVGNHWVGHQGADRVDWDQGVGWVMAWEMALGMAWDMTQGMA